MFKSFRIGSIFGIPLKLDITLLLILPVFTWLIGSQIEIVIPFIEFLFPVTIDPGPLTDGITPWVLGLVAAIGLFVGVALHELGHASLAIRYGYGIESITLWLLGGVAQLSDQPRVWQHEFWIAIAGPVVSIGVGVACYLIVLLTPLRFTGVIFIFGYLAILNIALAGFNMLPAFPLDGGRVLRAILGRNRPFAQATQEAVQIGKIFAVAFGIFGLFTFNFFIIAVAFFIYIAGSAEGRHTLIASIFEDVPIHDIMTPAAGVVTVPADMTLSNLLGFMMDHRHSGYPVTRDGEVVGMITINDIQDIPMQDREHTTVDGVMSTELKTLSDDCDAMEAFFEISQHDIGRLIVTNDRGDFVGLITRTDLIRAFDIIQQHKLIAEGQYPPPALRR